MTPDFDVILGDPWLSSQSAHIDYPNQTVRVIQNGEAVTLTTPPQDQRPKPQTHHIMSVAQAQRWLKQPGVQTYMIQVNMTHSADGQAVHALQRLDPLA